MLRVLDGPSVPFANIGAEGGVRMRKVEQKLSGGFRSAAGAEDFAIVRSVISTARKQGWNILHAVTQKPEALTQAIRAF